MRKSLAVLLALLGVVSLLGACSAGGRLGPVGGGVSVAD